MSEMPMTTIAMTSKPTPAELERQRGTALISAIVLACLYFALMELMLIDTTRALREADRFRSRTIACTLAEDAAELAAVQMVNRTSTPPVNKSTPQGQLRGSIDHNSQRFTIEGEGTCSGILPATEHVHIEGEIDGSSVKVNYTVHTQ